MEVFYAALPDSLTVLNGRGYRVRSLSFNQTFLCPVGADLQFLQCFKGALPKERLLTGFENLTSNLMPLTGKNLVVGDSLGM